MISDQAIRQRAQHLGEDAARKQLEGEAQARQQEEMRAQASEARRQHEIENQVGGALAQLRQGYQRRDELILAVGAVIGQLWEAETILRQRLSSAAEPLGQLRLDHPARMELLSQLRRQAGLQPHHQDWLAALPSDAGGDVASGVVALLLGGYIYAGGITMPSNSMTFVRRDRR